MHRVLLFILVTALIGACASTHHSACVYYFPSCDMTAPRPVCRPVTPADSSAYVNPAKLVGLVPANDLAAFLGPMTTTPRDSFVVKAARADAVWYVDLTRKMDGGWLGGEEGIVALQGCSVVAYKTLAIYN